MIRFRSFDTFPLANLIDACGQEMGWGMASELVSSSQKAFQCDRLRSHPPWPFSPQA